VVEGEGEVDEDFIGDRLRGVVFLDDVVDVLYRSRNVRKGKDVGNGAVRNAYSYGRTDEERKNESCDGLSLDERHMVHAW
jgi:hypothetical protein